MTAHEPPQWINIVDQNSVTMSGEDHITMTDEYGINTQIQEWEDLFERLDHIERLILNNTERLRELVEILKERA